MQPVVGPTPPRSSPGSAGRERAVHWTLAVLMLVCIVTAAILYNGSLGVSSSGIDASSSWSTSTAASRCRCPCSPAWASLHTERTSPDSTASALPTGSGFALETVETARLAVGKFNAGQKLNAALTAGSVVVLLGSGLLMYFPDLARLSWRTGATLVHDWFALGLGLLICGHLAQAFRDPEARRGMRTGRVSRTWAIEQHREWADEARREPQDYKRNRPGIVDE